MPVKVTVIPVSGISPIPGDTAPAGDPAWLPSIFNAVPIEFNIVFSYFRILTFTNSARVPVWVFVIEFEFPIFHLPG
jgi:hypothetical protein